MPPATAFPVFGQPIGHAALQLAPFGYDACYGCATVQGRRGRLRLFWNLRVRDCKARSKGYILRADAGECRRAR